MTVLGRKIERKKSHIKKERKEPILKKKIKKEGKMKKQPINEKGGR